LSDTDFSSAADGAASSASSSDGGGSGAAETSTPQPNGDGNQFSGDTRTVDAHPSSRDARAEAEQPVDLDAPKEWQTPAARAEVEALVKQLGQQQQPQPKPERPQDFPRSWKSDPDEFAIWNQLPEQTRQQITYRERERDTATSRAQSEYLAKQRDIEVAVQHAESTAWAALLEIQPQLEALGVRSNEDWQRLVQERPQDAQAIAAEMQQRQDRVSEFQKLRAEAAQQQQQQIEQLVTNAKASWEQQKAAEDAAAMKLIPELGDPAKAPAVQQRCMNYLKNDLGLSEQEISHLWNSDPTFHCAEINQ
jgi:hypothetical protein